MAMVSVFLHIQTRDIVALLVEKKKAIALVNVNN
jgi:hypothetical protein